ncbi:hypothetical protein ACFB49_15210 [Sphingomonas sp. DBB INV C78]|uniref:YbjN domain-containing protein n=1 Tax=Sphingomonas sp. DBB INV C78 TaxID=3349434 RepID=UPI0036D3FCE3
MMRGALWRGVAVGLLLTSAPAIAAAPKVAPRPGGIPASLNGDNLDAFVAVLQDAGYRAKLKANPEGQRYIDSAANGVPFSLTFTDCDGESGCKGVRFLAWWPRPAAVDAKAVNEWNDGYKLARAAIDADDDLVLDYYISLVGGVAAANFLDSFDWWTVLVGDFRDFLDTKQAEVKPAKPDDRKGVSAVDEDFSG